MFRIAPNAATVDFQNLMTGETILRAVVPEAKLKLDGRDFKVGGLEGQPERAYLLKEWLDSMTADPGAFRFREVRLGPTEPRLEWKRKRPAAGTPWPPPGLALTLSFDAPASAGSVPDVTVAVRYEIYDGLPLLAKWLSIENRGRSPVILSFGSGLDMENENPANIAWFRELAGYAHARGIEIGGYSLLASRSVSAADDVINPRTGKTGGAAFGNSPCLGSRWGRDYFRKITAFLEATGFDLVEHDGSYPGDLCASRDHPGHKGLEDSQWTQWKAITDFYKWCRGRGIYLNVPDWYFLNGSNKTGMGYRETNWSLPRDRQIILGRQNIFDGTWEKTPSMGWMFVPLVEYQGGGAAATLEPLAEHLDAYEAHLAQNFLGGVQACYRGTRLYDFEATKRVVRKWVDFYKRHRSILDSDIIHLRRPDGRDIDGIVHVNPGGEPRGLAVFHNPTGQAIDKTVAVPLYYTGLEGRALVRKEDGPADDYEIDRTHMIELPVRIPARGRTRLILLLTFPPVSRYTLL
ncbi:MAG: hypothetical protein A2W03_01145 [Candidatus Aminicenantes bacterium RBG_16_63_16]|nr:MAG: hypothetical protein A2W03_01145 [Candidatus Aminicenantes bacterium RBG_16_63_16]